MKFKDKYKIGGHWFDLKLTPCDNIDGGVGDFDRNNGIIRVSSDLQKSHREQAFLHEVMHIVNNEMEEKEIEYLSQAIYAFLSDNDMLK